MNTLLKGSMLAAFLVGTLVAQPPFGALNSSTPPDPATIVANKVTHLTALLTLTTAQASQATTIFTNAQTAITPLQTTLSEDWTQLEAAVKSNSTSTIDQLATSIGTITAQITAIRSKADAAFYAILTTAQQTALDASRDGFEGGPGGHGPRGPR
jgi:Spy/CpxP family protein refolding chaperone